MRAHGLSTTGWTHRLVGRARSGAGWYRQLRELWTARQAARRVAYLASLSTCWNATREAVRPLHAEAAIGMVASTHAYSTTAALCALSV
jgi:hypothetical protein